MVAYGLLVHLRRCWLLVNSQVQILRSQILRSQILMELVKDRSLAPLRNQRSRIRLTTLTQNRGLAPLNSQRSRVLARCLLKLLKILGLAPLRNQRGRILGSRCRSRSFFHKMVIVDIVSFGAAIAVKLRRPSNSRKFCVVILRSLVRMLFN